MTNITDIVLNKVKPYIENIPVPIMIGFSGGADSTVLTHALLTLLGRENIICLHVNHMLRGEDSDNDENHCREFCKANNINFLCAKVDVKSASKGVAVEEIARNIRYQVFSDSCQKNSCKYIALAHTKSDNCETIIFNIARGTGANGLTGIPVSRPISPHAALIRPLIGVSRDEIIEYCKENNLDYVTDKTNFDTKYTRNFIRSEIIPKMKEINPSFEDAIQTMAKNVGADNDFIDKIAADFIKDNMTSHGFEREKLNNLHYSISSRVIRTYAWHNLEDKHINQILYLSRNGSEGNVICLPFSMKACIENNYLVIYQKDKMPQKIERYIYSYQMPRVSTIFVEGFAISLSNSNPPPNHHLVGYMRCKLSDIPKMTIRSYFAKDKYYFYNMTRNIKKTAMTLDTKARMVRPCFLFNDEIIWYPGFPVSNTFNQEDSEVTIYYYEKD